MRGKKVLFILSLTVLVLFLLVGVFADFLAPCDPNAVDMANNLAMQNHGSYVKRYSNFIPDVSILGG